MKTWFDYEARFKALASRLQRACIDTQSSAAGEHWSVSPMTSDASAVQEFILLCHIAGKTASEAIGKKSELAELMNHEDPKVRWYRLLKVNSPVHSAGSVAFHTSDDGTSAPIYSGTIHDVANGSANLCLWLQAHAPIRQPWYATIWEEYGKKFIVGVAVAVAAMIITWALK